jgi:uncharacterized iron-regulated membrane protein
MTLRPFVFWPHLVAGVLAGSVILIMSVTGVLLTYEKQMLLWADGLTAVEPPPGASRLDPEEILSRVAGETGTSPSAITVRADAEMPVLVAAGDRNLLVNPYSGVILGDSAPRLRRFFRVVTDWHRWLAMSGEGRQTGRTITGWSNLLFLFIVVSGMYLWLPRRWSWRAVRSASLFNWRLSGKARDFNWHHVIGIWCAVPLFFIVVSITPISFPAANALIYRLAGEAPPPPPQRSAGPRGQRAEPSFAGLNESWRRAEAQAAGWQAITLRAPASPEAPLVFSIDRGTGGQPQLRGTLTVNRASGETRWEPFEALSTGRRIRSYARFLHTGEVLGLAGQTVAGIASFGAVFLVWTGLSLAYRRFFVRVTRSEDRRERTAA